MATNIPGNGLKMGALSNNVYGLYALYEIDFDGLANLK